MHDGRMGFEVRPDRHPVVTAAIFVVVVVFSVVLAHEFRESAAAALEWIGGSADPIEAVRRTDRVLVFVLAVLAIVAGSVIDHLVRRRWPTRVGVEAVAASARGDGPTISLTATVGRASATWLATGAFVSIGRESAIVETTGAFGSALGRRTGGRGDTMAAAGIAAGFAAAYHSPLGALLYVEEHLRVRRSRRASRFAVAAALGGFALTWLIYREDPLLPEVEDSYPTTLLLGALILIPAVLASRAFLQLRTWSPLRAQGSSARRWPVVVLLALVSAGTVALVAAAAGNGGEALRESAVEVTVGLAVAMALAKLVATIAALAAGAPGGVLTPTMTVAAGAGLLSVLAARELGLSVEHPWTAAVVAMAVGVAVGLRSPLMAVVFVPELTGDYALALPLAVVVAAAWGLDQGIDALVSGRGGATPDAVYDEDA